MRLALISHHLGNIGKVWSTIGKERDRRYVPGLLVSKVSREEKRRCSEDVLSKLWTLGNIMQET